ncbi:hypothetical protein PGB90_000305 [Kerria lacca]
MSLSNILQNTRCYICGLNLLRSTEAQIFIRMCSNISESKEIVIPKRIPRGPTDILKALASTIKRDPTAPHYKFHDDPYLIPISNSSKRIFALSQESGRKTAMWVREKHAELFQHREAEPPIEAFFPKIVYDETDDVDNETLAKLIKSALISDSINVYKLMQKCNVEISEDNKQALLELLCFFNETEQLAEELIEERWFSRDMSENLKKTWRNGSYAEKLFEELPKNSKTYSAIILGMLKYNEIERGYKLYQEAINEGFILSVNVYNSIIKVSSLVASLEQRWNFITENLSIMNEHGHKPNLQTLNAILFALMRMPKKSKKQELALNTIAELKKFGVEPSLGSYHFLLLIFSNVQDISTHFNILSSILDNIQGKEFTIRDSSDVLFFFTAMDTCRYYLNDINIAYRVNELLWFGNNYNLIGNSIRESIYYRNFFCLIIQSEDLKTIFKFYDFYVPNIYTPEINVMEELIKTVTMNGAVEYYPKLWTDIVLFEMWNKQQILIELLRGMVLNNVSCIPPSEISIQLGETAWSSFVKNEDSLIKTKIEWTGEMLGNILSLCLSADNFERAGKIFMKLVKDETQIIGVPQFNTLNTFLDACIKNRDVKLCFMCIEYSFENGYDNVTSLAKKLIKNINLSPANKTHLAALLGQEIFKDEEELNNMQTDATI